MDSTSTNAPAPSIDLGTIYYTLFRHKWKIIVCSLLGIVAAFAGYRLMPPPYVSEAKLFIRYVITDAKAPGPGRDESITKSPDQRGETIISSEMEILTSLDLAEQVVKNIGAEKILAKTIGGKDATLAAALIQKNLLVEVPLHSSVLRIVLKYPDPDIVQMVLRDLVDSYLKKHVEIHRAAGIVNDFLTQETDQLRSRLAQTEEELRKATNKAGIISLEDYKKTSGEQSARLKQQISELQAELAERMSVYNEMTKNLPKTTATTEANAPAALPPAQIAAYQKVEARLGLLRQREQELLTQFTEESPRILELRSQLTEAENQKKTLETEFPALAQLRRPAAATAITPNGSPEQFNPQFEAVKINSLQARLKALNGQLEEIRTEAGKVDQLEISILELRRRKELDEANYRYYSASLEQSHINEALGNGRVSNISVIESPTPPAKDAKKITQLLAGISVGGIVLGLAWAFVIELYFDRSIRRPAEVERLLRAPLFISIPQFKLKTEKAPGSRYALPAPASPPPAPFPAAEPSPGTAPGQSDPTGSASSDQLVPFHQTLRDRLINYFDSINLKHKPKLIAVTGLGRNSGVTTTAAGLARSLSETGEGNVLLVDMTQSQGSSLHFQRGTQIGLEQLLDTRNSAFVHDNLYVVSEHSGGERLAKGLPQRFNQLVPKLKSSDFDYIIFDMPPVNQISITPRLASFMDLTLLVVESEKTDRELAAHASALLAKNNTRVGVVMNKSKSYIPSRLQHEQDFLLGT